MSSSEQVSYPLKQKSGWYVLSDGRKVRGEGAAVVAEAGLMTGLTEPVSVPDAVPPWERGVEGHSADMVVVDDPTPMPVPVAPSRGTVFVDCRTHPSGNGTGLAAPNDLWQVVDHSFCPAPR
jgi:hypothetical protein